MVRADEETAAPDLTYSLRASGYHAVSLGLMAESSEDVVVLARVSGDASSTVLTCPMTDRAGRHRVRELFWKIADLSSQDLVIGQQNRRIAAETVPGDEPRADLFRAYRLGSVGTSADGNSSSAIPLPSVNGTLTISQRPYESGAGRWAVRRN